MPFLAYSPEIRKVIYSTNAIESVHARFRRSVRARGHFPNEQAAMKCLYLTIRSLDPTGRSRWTNRWKPALNAFAVTFEERINLNNNCHETRQLHRKSDTPATVSTARLSGSRQFLEVTRVFGTRPLALPAGSATAGRPSERVRLQVSLSPPGFRGDGFDWFPTFIKRLFRRTYRLA